MANRVKHPSEVRTHIFPVRLSDVELDAIRERAKKAGVTASELMRRSALSRPLPRLISRSSVQTYVELGRIGNNINQLTRAANTAINQGQPLLVDVANLAALAELLHALRREIIMADEKYLSKQSSDLEPDAEDETDDWSADERS